MLGSAAAMGKHNCIRKMYSAVAAGDYQWIILLNLYVDDKLLAKLDCAERFIIIKSLPANIELDQLNKSIQNK